MWWVSLTLAISLMTFVLILRRRRREPPVILIRTLRRMPWELVPFMLSMFILVIDLSEGSVCDALVSILGDRMPIAIYGLSSFFTANLINNIPMSVLFASLAEGVGLQGAAYAAVIGSNLGACLTPVGALAGIMWADILRRERISFDYRDFLRIGSITSLPTLVAALGALALVL
jgi:arsenical pump membrane protein